MQGLNVNVSQCHKPASHISDLNISVSLLAQNDGKCSLLTRVGKTSSHSYLKKNVSTFFFFPCFGCVSAPWCLFSAI